MKKLYIDFDGTIVNTIAAIVSLYNDDFKYYKEFYPIKWWEVNTWDFKECKLATNEYINKYFNQERFFKILTYMDWAKEILEELKNEYHITIVSIGSYANLKGKSDWILYNLPFCDFIGINLDENKDKSCINMSDGILIDDMSKNLKNNNAAINICFGDEYEWNKDWDGFRCKNWNDIKNFLKGVNS